MVLYEHVFTLSEIQIYRVLKNYSLDDFKDIELPLFDRLDMKMIDSYAQLVIREGRNQIKSQSTAQNKPKQINDGQLKIPFI